MDLVTPIKRMLNRRDFARSMPLALGALFCGCTAKAPVAEESHHPKEGKENAVSTLNMYLNGFHFYADDMGRQIEAHHYCHHLSDEVFQCVIFDGNTPGSRLIGVEYIVSEKLFREFPDEEKELWHSHHYEVSSGALVIPDLTSEKELEAMKMVVSTYGKTWHTWQIDRGDKLPLGLPQLMMGFTKDGQLKPEHLKAREARMGISAEKKVAERSGIPMPSLVKGANGWEDGTTPQITTKRMKVKNFSR